MIETPDKKLFTYKKNYPKLIEFSRTIGAGVSLVQVQQAEVLDIQQLATMLCAPQKGPNDEPEYILLNTKIPRPGSKLREATGRARKREVANRVKSFVEAEFLVGNEVSLKGIRNKFKNYGLSDSTLSNHIRTVKKAMEKKGRKIKGTKGRYFL